MWACAQRRVRSFLIIVLITLCPLPTTLQDKLLKVLEKFKFLKHLNLKVRLVACFACSTQHAQAISLGSGCHSA